MCLLDEDSLTPPLSSFWSKIWNKIYRFRIYIFQEWRLVISENIKFVHLLYRFKDTEEKISQKVDFIFQ